ncbi:hypothetical protein HMPREF9946_02194 [Acetobacteraceae bacterium AT-5844]|nr:hypothetical protein HMPREF9946_02194 [Acetobacteraceae bacterium AT-5844]
MSPANDNRLPPPFLRCDVPGCTDEIAVRVGDEQRCFCHAMERAREMRNAKGSAGE